MAQRLARRQRRAGAETVDDTGVPRHPRVRRTGRARGGERDRAQRRRHDDAVLRVAAPGLDEAAGRARLQAPDIGGAGQIAAAALHRRDRVARGLNVGDGQQALLIGFVPHDGHGRCLLSAGRTAQRRGDPVQPLQCQCPHRFTGLCLGDRFAAGVQQRDRSGHQQSGSGDFTGFQPVAQRQDGLEGLVRGHQRRNARFQIRPHVFGGLGHPRVGIALNHPAVGVGERRGDRHAAGVEHGEARRAGIFRVGGDAAVADHDRAVVDHASVAVQDTPVANHQILSRHALYQAETHKDHQARQRRRLHPSPPPSCAVCAGRSGAVPSS